MLLKMIARDLKRNKLISAGLFLFIMVPAFLISGGSIMLTELSGSLDSFFNLAKIPHFVQMHTGKINRMDIEKWASENPDIKDFQIVEMINIDGSDLYLGSGSVSEAETVMDLGFVRQNSIFDLLLDTENKPVSVSRGEIGVPLYYRQKGKLKTGDTVKIAGNNSVMKFRIKCFVRDAQMNPSIVHSKRFVINKEDFNILKNEGGESEYLIEFLLNNSGRIGDFADAYEDSGLPSSGPAVNYNLFRIINSLTESIGAVLLIIISILFCITAVICLGFSIRTAVEEDYSEIGVMKAIGIQMASIKRIYLAKYSLIAAVAASAGYILSVMSETFLTSGISFYLGSAPKNSRGIVIPLLSALIIFLAVVLSCLITLGKFNRVSAVEALRGGADGGTPLRCGKNRILGINLSAGLRDVFYRSRLYRLLFLVYFVSVFLIIVPVNFLNTIKSPDFVTYMGIGKSDIRIDLRMTDDISGRFDDLIMYIANDKDVVSYSPLVTSRFRVENSDGVRKDLNVESGDFSIFPLEYISGFPPSGSNEIALSYLNAKELEKKTGDKLVLFSGDREREVVISGIYQDITNGGLTAKGSFPPDKDEILWYVVGMNVKSGISSKVSEYSDAFYPARVTSSGTYLSQTMGETIERIKLITVISVLITVSVAMMITVLFLRMIVAGDRPRITIMKCIGFSFPDLRIQYITGSLFVLGMGIITGTIVSNTAGQSLAGFIWSFLGASEIRFIINPLESYLLYPLLLVITVTLSTLISTGRIKGFSIADMNGE